MNEEINISAPAEISQALKQFEAESTPVPQSPQVQISPDMPKIVQLVIKYSGGSIKEQKQAEYVLFFFFILAMGVSVFLFFGLGHTKTTVPPEALQQMIQTHIGQ